MKKLLKGLLGVFVILVVVGALASMFGGGDGDAEPAMSEPLKLGDTWTHKNISYQVTNVKRSTGKDFIKPDAGNVWIEVELLIENKSKSDFTVSSVMMFSAVDDEGYTYDITIGDGSQKQIDGTVAAGSKLKGAVVFEVPTSAKTLDVRITPGLVSETRGVWRLELPTK